MRELPEESGYYCSYMSLQTYNVHLYISGFPLFTFLYEGIYSEDFPVFLMIVKGLATARQCRCALQTLHTVPEYVQFPKQDVLSLTVIYVCVHMQGMGLCAYISIGQWLTTSGEEHLV